VLLCYMLALVLCHSYPGQGPFFYTLKNQAFPNNGHSGAMIYLPSSFNVTTDPLDIAVFIHGFSNCIENCYRDSADAISCTKGQPKRSTYSLIDQIEKIKFKGMLLLPEVAYDQRSSNPGNFANKGVWANFITELFESARDVLGTKTIQNIRQMGIFSHSGAYLVTADISSIGGNTKILQIVLLDSLYGSIPTYDSYIKNSIPNMGPSPTGLRFANVYTDHGGTFDNSIAEARYAQNLFNSSSKSGEFIWDNTYGVLPDGDFGKYACIFKRTETSHDGVPKEFFGKFLAAWST